jgi:transposase
VTGSSRLPWRLPAAAGGWLDRHGQVGMVGVEGTGSYGAGLAGYLLDQQVRVVEVGRPDRRTRRQRGKSDPIDAEADHPAPRGPGPGR